MCGIAGFVDFKKQSTEEVLRQMTDAMTLRGPDDAGYEVYQHPQALIGFGQRRLSILDLSPLGHQPMHFNDLVVDFNGEIYNFKEIRKVLEDLGYTFKSWSDTEVILKGYHCWGLDVLQKFIGMFAIVLYDKQKDQVIFMRDRAGVKPLYYYWNNDTFLFGSELKALYRHPAFEKKIDTNSMALFLQFSYIPAPYTIFYNTHKLLPGHVLVLDLKTKRQELKKYWDVIDQYNRPKISISDEEAIEQTDKLLKNAYEYRMVA